MLTMKNVDLKYETRSSYWDFEMMIVLK